MKMAIVQGLHFNNLRGIFYGGVVTVVVALPPALAFGVASGAGANIPPARRSPRSSLNMTNDIWRKRERLPPDHRRQRKEFLSSTGEQVAETHFYVC